MCILVYLRDESEIYRELLRRVIPVYWAEDSVYSAVRSLPFRNAISIDGWFPVAPQYIFWSVAWTQKHRHSSIGKDDDETVYLNLLV